MRMTMRMKSIFAVFAMLLALCATPVFAFTNPAKVTTGVYTPVSASSTAVSIGSSLSLPSYVERLEIQNQCGSPVTIQFNGAPAVFGQGYLLAAGATRTWRTHDGPIPSGSYSFITQSVTCTPDSATGLVILELP